MAAETIPMRGGYPEPPAKLKKAGRDAWRIGIDLWREGVLTVRDIPNFTLFCEAFDEKRKCELIVKRDGEYQMTANGCYAQHPAIKRRQQAEAIIRKYSSAFGLIPDARKKRPAIQQGVASRPK